MVVPITAYEERLRSRHPFVHAARNLLNELSTPSTRAAQWIDYKWDVKYSKDTLKTIRDVPLCRKAQCQASWHGSAQTCLGTTQPPSHW